MYSQTGAYSQTGIYIQTEDTTGYTSWDSKSQTVDRQTGGQVLRLHFEKRSETREVVVIKISNPNNPKIPHDPVTLITLITIIALLALIILLTLVTLKTLITSQP
jgi:hypothetical protein